MIREISSTEVELKFYGEINSWSLRSGKTFSAYFAELDKKYKDIIIRMHCYGGEVFEGNLIYNTIANAKANVTIIVDGVAASMGSIVALAGSTAPKIARNAYIMIHCPSGRTSGNAAAHLASAKLLRSMEKNFAKTYSQRTGQPETDVHKYFDGNDHWIDAEEALELGFASEIIEPVAKDINKIDKAEAKSMGVEAVYGRYAAELTIEKPKSNKSDIKKSEMDKVTMIARYGLESVTAESSDTAIFEAMDKKLKAEQDARKKAEDKVAEIEKTNITSLIEAKANEEGVEMTDAEKANYKMIGETAGVEALKMALQAVKPRQTIASQVIHSKGKKKPEGGGENRSDWTWEDYQEKAPKALEKMEDENKEEWQRLYKAEFGELPE